MKNIFIRLIFFGFISVSTFSCISGDSSIALSINPYEESPMVYVDTFTVNSYTVRMDSSLASTSGNLLVGSINQPFFGNVSASSYFQILAPTTNLYNIQGNETMVYDSLVLVLKYGTCQGDTLVAQTLKLNQLQTAPPNNTLFYTPDNLPIETISIAAKSLKPRTKIDTAFNLKISDAIGQQLFTKLTTKASITQSEMNTVIKGLKLYQTDNKSAFLMQFLMAKSYLRLYSHTNRTLTQYYTTLQLMTGLTQFNNFDYNSKYGILNQNKALLSQVNSTNTDNRTYIYNGINLGTKITIPYLSNIKFIPKYRLITKAQLQVTAQMQTKNDWILPPSTLAVSLLNSKNQITTGLTTGNAPGYGNPMVGSFVLGTDPLILDGVYTFDVTNYLNGILNGNFTSNGILLTVPAGSTPPSTLSGVTLGNSKNQTFKTTLKIYYSQGLTN